jgi:hypothetical protein
MAIPKLFKAFHHEQSKQIYVESASSRYNPILIAHTEYKIASTEDTVEIEYPDIVLSLGTGAKTTSSQNSKDSEKPSLLSRLRRQGSTKTQQRGTNRQILASREGGDAWDDYLNQLPISAPPSRFVRLNPALKDLPASDGIESIDSIQSVVQNYYASGNQIKRLAAQLFATLFYFECSETILETEDNQVTVQGKYTYLPSSN